MSVFKNLWPILIITFFFACSSDENKGEQLEIISSNMDDDTDENSVDEIQEETIEFRAFSDRAIEGFSKFFSSKLMLELDNYLFEYNTIENDVDFQVNYEKGMKLFSELYNAFENPRTEYLINLKEEGEYWDPVSVVLGDLEELEGELGPIVFSCAAECTELDFIYDLRILKEKAKISKGQSDDDFIAISIFNDGDYGCANCWSWKNWFAQTWDLGGSSLIGEGILFESIEMYIDFKDKHESFQSEMEHVYNNYMEELTNGYYSYMLSREEVLEEYDNIIELGLFNEEETERILENRKKLEDVNSEIEFNCQDGHCSYG